MPAASGLAAAPLEEAAVESAEDEAELAASGTAGERGGTHRLKPRRSACCQSCRQSRADGTATGTVAPGLIREFLPEVVQGLGQGSPGPLLPQPLQRRVRQQPMEGRGEVGPAVPPEVTDARGG